MDSFPAHRCAFTKIVLGVAKQLLLLWPGCMHTSHVCGAAPPYSRTCSARRHAFAFFERDGAFFHTLPRQVLRLVGRKCRFRDHGTYRDLHALRVFDVAVAVVLLCIVVAVSCVGWRRVLQRSVVAECCRDVLRRSVAEKFCRGERSREGL